MRPRPFRQAPIATIVAPADCIDRRGGGRPVPSALEASSITMSGMSDLIDH